MEHIDQDNTQQEDETNGELKAEDLDSEDDYDDVDAANNKELQRTQDSQFVYFIIFFWFGKFHNFSVWNNFYKNMKFQT